MRCRETARGLKSINVFPASRFSWCRSLRSRAIRRHGPHELSYLAEDFHICERCRVKSRNPTNDGVFTEAAEKGRFERKIAGIPGERKRTPTSEVTEEIAHSGVHITHRHPWPET